MGILEFRLRRSERVGKNLLFPIEFFCSTAFGLNSRVHSLAIEVFMFTLHSQLAADTAEVLDLQICRVLLMNDSRYPWIILVPKQENLVELHDLDTKSYSIVTDEIRHASEIMSELFTAHKINIGALGNMVPQLHIHVIVRQTGDPAWPGPVWGVGSAIPYISSDLTSRIQRIDSAFAAYKTS
jgi:diadenosine tetraphosphate (Ap4A) HIT family hydrolase